MARTNYSFAKRQKELDKLKKKEEKKKKKDARKAGLLDLEGVEATETECASETDEDV